MKNLTQLKKELTEMNAALQTGLESGLYVHPSETGHLNYRAGESYNRMISTICQIEDAIKLQEMTIEEAFTHAGGVIKDAGEGNVFSTSPSGKNIRSSQVRFMAIIEGWTSFSRSLDGAILKHSRAGRLDLLPYGFDNCGKCGGSGTVPFNVDGGVCWTCNGFGFVKEH